MADDRAEGTFSEELQQRVQPYVLTQHFAVPSAGDCRYDGAEQSFAMTVVDGTSASIALGSRVVRVGEQGTATYTVRLTSMPASPVLIELSEKTCRCLMHCLSGVGLPPCHS